MKLHPRSSPTPRLPALATPAAALCTDAFAATLAAAVLGPLGGSPRCAVCNPSIGGGEARLGCTNVLEVGRPTVGCSLALPPLALEILKAFWEFAVSRLHGGQRL